MLARCASLLAFSGLLLASCQTSKSALISPRGPMMAEAAAADSATAVVLMHSSQGPEPVRVTVSMAEARTMSAARAEAQRR